MDNASPEWQAVLREAMAQVSALGRIEGARIDVADGQGPNWGSPRYARASFSEVGAGVEVLAAVRDGIRSGGCRRPVLIPESRVRPVYFALPDAAVLGYGWGLTQCLAQATESVLQDAAELNRRLYAELEEERGSLPPGALVLRTLNNHDTVCDKGRVQERFGAGLQRALYGVCLAVPGVPMLYQEEEIGSYLALRQLHAARQALPWLAQGEERYLPPNTFDERVFAVWRSAGDRGTLCLVNLSGLTVTGSAPLPQPGRCRLTDAVSGASVETAPDGRLQWTLAPYATAFLVPGRAPRPDLPPERFAGEEKPAPGSVVTGGIRYDDSGFRLTAGEVTLALHLEGPHWQSAPEAEGGRRWTSAQGSVTVVPKGPQFEVRCEFCGEEAAPPAVVLTLEGVDGWAVAGRTGLLQDRVVRRHFPFPDATGYRWERTHVWGHGPWGGLYQGIAPCGRLWQSLLEPLHLERRALGFTGREGRGLLLSAIRTDAMNVVLTDGSDEGTRRSPQLEVRFLAVDRDLHPDVQRFGPRPFWQGQDLPALDSRPLSVTFTVAPLVDSLAAALAVEPLPRQMADAAETRHGGPFAEMGGRLFTIGPSRITWTELPAVDQTCLIELELRLSERSADDTDLAEAYRVRLDGAELPLTWGRRNVWSTGNAYFALARTPPVDLRGRTHVLTIETLHTWCALRPRFALVAADPNQ